RRRHAAVDRTVHDRLGDLLLRAAVAQRAADVQRQLLLVPTCDEHRDGEQASRARRQLRPGPDGAPAVLDDELLQRREDVVRIGHRSGDVLFAEDLRPYFEAGGRAIVAHDSDVHTVFVSRYESRPSRPCSRPTPDALTPPNGTAGSLIPQRL